MAPTMALAHRDAILSSINVTALPVFGDAGFPKI
jgi:hypothetical protein